ncbi:expressed unknown protein [Seminavis robusta]|uniref:Uncharacterized protein n=1 Tax=Seminavis robusta TaxID=568900 RepID=A0A9N8EQJ9_9STRA|nr:expressed unknown protein [Seminavis robusta]|eukprot:Sro1401_g269520.1 n/a (86) ;mRNA; r:27792-28149
MTEDEFDAAATASMHKLQANMEAQRSMDAATIDSKYSWMLDLSLDELVAKYAPQKGTTSVAGTIERQSQQKRSPGQQHRFGASPL